MDDLGGNGISNNSSSSSRGLSEKLKKGATLPNDSKIKSGNIPNPTEGLGNFGMSESSAQERGDISSSSTPSLGNKDELGPKESLEKESLEKEDKSKNEPDSTNETAGAKTSQPDQAKEKETPENNQPGSLKDIIVGNMSFKTKLILIGSGIALGILGLLFVVMFLYHSAYFIWGTLFGVDIDTLFSEKLNTMDTDEVTAYLADSGICSQTGWEEFTSFLKNLFSNSRDFADACDAIRYINKQTKTKEDTYLGGKFSIDRGLVISTVLYGYSNREDQVWLTKDYLSGKLDEDAYQREEPDDPIKILQEVIESGYIDKDDVDNIINSLIHEEVYPIFHWVYIEGDDEDEGKYFCIKSEVKNFYYDEEKYLIYMRYGYKAPEGDFDAAGYISLNGTKVLKKNSMPGSIDISSYQGEGYVFDANMLKSWLGTDIECKVEGAAYSPYDAASVNAAVGFYTSKGMYPEPNLDPKRYREFLDLDGPLAKSKDVEKEFDVPCLKDGKNQACTLSYKNGYAFNEFPSFKKAFDNNTGEVYEYDEIFTFNHIESLISEVILDHRTTFNDLMGYTYDREQVPIPGASEGDLWEPGDPWDPSDIPEETVPPGNINNVGMVKECKYTTNYDAQFNQMVVKLANEAIANKEYIGDCSKFVRTIYNRAYAALGINKTFSGNSASSAKYNVDKCVTEVGLMPGDLVYWYKSSATDRWNNIHHVAIYMGNGLIAETNTSKSASISGSRSIPAVTSIWCASGGCSSWKVNMFARPYP